MRLRIATALALLFVLAVPTLAQARSLDPVLKDCADGSLDKKYSQAAYAKALANIPADLDEYSDCRGQIQRAQLGGSSGSGSGGGTSGGGTTGGGTTGGGTTGGGAATGDTGAATGGGVPDPLASATEAERQAFQKAVVSGASPVKLDGRPIYPDSLGGAKTNGLGDLPTSMLAILALLAVGGLGAAGFGTRRLVHGRRPA